jgi:hypothetical protein
MTHGGKQAPAGTAIRLVIGERVRGPPLRPNLGCTGPAWCQLLAGHLDDCARALRPRSGIMGGHTFDGPEIRSRCHRCAGRRKKASVFGLGCIPRNDGFLLRGAYTGSDSDPGQIRVGSRTRRRVGSEVDPSRILSREGTALPPDSVTGQRGREPAEVRAHHHRMQRTCRPIRGDRRHLLPGACIAATSTFESRGPGFFSVRMHS